MKYIIPITSLVIASVASAALRYDDFASDSSSNIINGSWTGDGTIVASVAPSTGSGFNSIPFINGFSGTGTVRVDSFDGDFPPGGANITYMLGATGSADLEARNDAFDDSFGGFQLTNLTDVSELTIVIDFDSVISSPSLIRDSSSAFVSTPWIGSLDVGSVGTGQSDSDFQVAMSLGGVVSSTDGGVTFTPGLAAGYDFIESPLMTQNADGISWTANSFESGGDVLMLGGVDTNGDGVHQSWVDGGLVYADKFTFTITKDDGSNFASDTQFVVTLDGSQTATAPTAQIVSDAIPEPTSFALLALGASTLLGRRRRK